MCAWKTVRSRPKVAANSEAAVVDATGRALAAGDESTRIAALLELEGVGVPTASTLLYFAFPDDYPILDVRALESLGVKPRSQYPVSFWLEYLGRVPGARGPGGSRASARSTRRSGSTPRSSAKATKGGDMPTPDLLDRARDMYLAFASGDRAAIERTLSDDFSFSR